MTEETVTVEVQTPGFSVFTVYIDDETATPTPTPETTPTPIPPEQPTPTETDTPEDSDELGAFGMVGGIALLVVLVLVVVAGAALYRTRQDPTSDLLESLRSSDGSWLDRRR